MTTMAPEAAEITEIVEMDVDLVNGVGTPANGARHLLMKGLGDGAKAASHPFTGTHGHPHPAYAGPDGDGNGQHSHEHRHDGDGDHDHQHAGKAVVRGKIDQAPDIDLADQILALIGKAISSEADEVSAGKHDETGDVALLHRAAEIVRQWKANEHSGETGDGAWKSAAKSHETGCGCCENCTLDAASKAELHGSQRSDLPDSAFAYIEPGGTKEDGKTRPDKLRHFPVHDEAHARNALARLSSSPFGDKAKPKVMAAARKFGIDTDGDNDGDAGKGALAEQEADVDTEAVAKAVTAALPDALTKAMQPVLDKVTAKVTELDELIAKVKATPQPGGPVMSAAALGRSGPAADDHAAKAAFYDERAGLFEDSNPQLAAGYRKLASEARREAAIAP